MRRGQRPGWRDASADTPPAADARRSRLGGTDWNASTATADRPGRSWNGGENMRRARIILMALAGATMVAIGAWAPSATAAPTATASTAVLVGSGSPRIDSLVSVPRVVNLKRAEA